MNISRIERFKRLKELGFTHEDGLIYKNGELQKSKNGSGHPCLYYYEPTLERQYQLLVKFFVWFEYGNEDTMTKLVFVDGDKLNLRIDNIKLKTDIPKKIRPKKKYVRKPRPTLTDEQKLANKIKKNPHYVNQDDFKLELIKCQELGRCTDKAALMMQKIANGVAKRMYYKTEEIREDCLSEALLCMISNFHNFNPAYNPFSYFTEVAKRGLAKQWNELNYKKTYKGVRYGLDLDYDVLHI